ncbi:uncharacterized protein LOC105433592 [Pogonomyrmex barbatus]|uniref:Uncharacterized protein LOC105433592 n=1 Tax=Pogonomyrmex barbatus TaxID=144034 RepID=A0A6I9WV98_9HYME|nr:uncharacterized protein LOC105433592 [Pogonomyrmex barbatus]
MLFTAIIMSSMVLLRRQLINTMKRFKFEELESAVIPIFPEITWTRVRSKLIKNHKNFTTTNAIHVIEEILDNIDLRKKDLHDRLAMLLVTDVSRHNVRKVWYGYELINPSGELGQFGKEELQARIKEKFHSNDTDVDVKVVMYNNIIFISVKEEEVTRKKKQWRYSMPIFFAFFLGHKYIFCSRKNIPVHYIKMIAISLGYNNGKSIKLMGKDLKSLIKLLWIKQQGTLCAENIGKPLVYKSSDPVVSINGIDYKQNKQRRKYAEQCFGKDPPTIDLLVVKGPEESIQHNIVASKLPNETIHMNWEFRSHSIPRFLSALIEKRAFTLPLHDYVSNLMRIGRNELKVKIDDH